MLNKITKDMTVEEVLEKFPQMVEVFMKFNVPCLVCGEPLWGTIEEVAKKYNVDLAELLFSLNGATDE